MDTGSSSNSSCQVREYGLERRLASVRATPRCRRRAAPATGAHGRGGTRPPWSPWRPPRGRSRPTNRRPPHRARSGTRRTRAAGPSRTRSPARSCSTRCTLRHCRSSRSITKSSSDRNGPVELADVGIEAPGLSEQVEADVGQRHVLLDLRGVGEPLPQALRVDHRVVGDAEQVCGGQPVPGRHGRVDRPARRRHRCRALTHGPTIRPLPLPAKTGALERASTVIAVDCTPAEGRYPPRSRSTQPDLGGWPDDRAVPRAPGVPGARPVAATGHLVRPAAGARGARGGAVGTDPGRRTGLRLPLRGLAGPRPDRPDSGPEDPRRQLPAPTGSGSRWRPLVARRWSSSSTRTRRRTRCSWNDSTPRIPCSTSVRTRRAR